METFVPSFKINENTICYMQNPSNGEEMIINNVDELDIPHSVKKLLKKVRMQILNLDSPARFLKLKPENIVEVDDIKHIFVKKYMYRRGCVLLAVQKSSLGRKILYYYTKTIHHNGECFHTTPDIKLINNLKKDLETDDKLNEIIKYTFEHIL